MRNGVPVAVASVVLSAAYPLPVSAEMPAPRMLDAAGARFPFVTAGKGEPVLFVHGSFSDHRTWGGLWQDVAEHHRFIAYTRRWYGTGDWPPPGAAWPRLTQVEDLVAILKVWGEPMHLVGWSNSGQVVLKAAHEVPDLVRSVVIYEPTLIGLLYETPEGTEVADAFEAGWVDTDAAVAAQDYAEAMREAIEYAWGLPEGGFETLDPAVQALRLELAPNLAREWLPQGPALVTCDVLHEVTAPVLLITGANTLPAYTLGAKAAAECLPHAETTVIEGVGHGGPIVAKDAFVTLTLGFIDAH
jgi:pimeloyl-ACP methyl ester carboxylesterase